MSQQSLSALCSQPSGRWLNGAGGCLQHACLLLWISLPLTFLVCGMSDVVPLLLSSPHLPQLKGGGSERHRSPSWSSWPHITGAHLSDPPPNALSLHAGRCSDFSHPCAGLRCWSAVQYFQVTLGSGMTAIKKWGRSTPGSCLASGRKHDLSLSKAEITAGHDGGEGGLEPCTGHINNVQTGICFN